MFPVCFCKKKRATWFATHKSAAVEDLLNVDTFEIGIHPNFLESSSHGTSVLGVLDNITRMFPSATVMRTHGLYQSSHMLHEAATKFGVKIDVSLLLPYHPRLQVLPPMGFGGDKICRVPYFWEDDIEMLNGYSMFDFNNLVHHCEGLKIYDFHPVHVALNISSFDDYIQLKEKKPVQQWDRKFILAHQKGGRGSLYLFEKMLGTIDLTPLRIPLVS